MRFEIRHAAAIYLMLIVGSVSAGTTISRFQFRESDNEISSFTQSVFHQFDNRLYLLELYESSKDRRIEDQVERFELNVGMPFALYQNGSTLGWVFRQQHWSSHSSISSGGIQYDFKPTSIPSPAGNIDLKTFIQTFVKSSPDAMGHAEIYHYYQFKGGALGKLEVRGSNVFYSEPYSMAALSSDFIYPLSRNFDLYLRWSFLSRDSDELGYKGNTTSIGFRFNL